MAPRIVLVPFPLTALTAFASFFLERLGTIRPETVFRFHASPQTKRSEVSLGDGAILNLAALDLLSYLRERLTEFPREERGPLKRLLTYVCFGDMAKGRELTERITRLSLACDDPSEVLRACFGIFQRCLDEAIDPWQLKFFPVAEQVPPNGEKPYPLDKRIVSLPIFRSREPSETETETKTEVVAVSRYELEEGKARLLEGARIGIVVGGPPGSGKSTLAASLAAEMNNILESLATREVWRGFSLKVEMVSLDLATPTLDAISVGMGKDRQVLEEKKRPWSQDLALEALENFIEAKKRVNIVIADLPGKIDVITEIVASYADCAVLITKEWALMRSWQEFIHRMGLVLVSQARSRSSQEGMNSVVTRYHRGKLIAGRVVDLDRVTRSWDPFISWLAEFLLFDILPALKTQRRERLQRTLGIFVR